MIGKRMRLIWRLRERLSPRDRGLSFHPYVSAQALIKVKFVFARRQNQHARHGMSPSDWRARRVRYAGGEASANESAAEKSLPAFA
jgi:hypothetical protein